jgi:hypothetical protein
LLVDFLSVRPRANAPEGQKLAEMIATGNAKTKAFEWIWDALPKIKAYIKTLQSGTAFPYNQPLMELALDTHFKISVSMPVADKITNLSVIQDAYEKVETSLHNSGQSFRGQLLAEAISDKGVDNAGKRFQKSINFTSSFTGFGPLCQAAMVLHENVHYVDSAATTANDIYEHSAGYNTMSLLQACVTLPVM